MRKLIIVLIAIFTMVISSFSEDRSNILKIYNWADYISPEVLTEFPIWYEQQTGEHLELIYNTFDINENMLTQIEVGHEDYDVICPSEYIIDRMLKLDLLLPIDKQIISDSINYFNNVSKFAIDNFNQLSTNVNVNDYAIGYMWGTTGWLYNEEYVSKDEVSSWEAILNPKFKNAIYMKDAFRDVYSVIVSYAYYQDILDGKVTRYDLVQNLNKERIDSVGSILKQMKENIAGWEVDFGKEEMAKGINCINLSWSGDAQWAIQEAAEVGIKLNYEVPIEGTNAWFDGWCIPKYAKNTKAATYFINYMCRSDNAIKNMEEIGYVSVIGTPEILEWAQDTMYPAINVSYMFGQQYDSICINPVMYPDELVIDRAALMKDCGDNIEDITAMWNSVKGDNLSRKWKIVMIVVASTISLIIITRVIKKIKNKKSGTKLKKKKQK